MTNPITTSKLSNIPQKLIELYAGLPDYKKHHSFNNVDIEVQGLNDPFDGNIVQFAILYGLDGTEFLSFQQQNKINNEVEYNDYTIIGQTTSDAFIAINKQNRIVILDFDCSYVGSEDNVNQVYKTNLTLDDIKTLITEFNPNNITPQKIKSIKSILEKND